MTYNTLQDPLSQFVVCDDGNYDNSYNNQLEASRTRQVRQMAGHEVLGLMQRASIAAIRMVGSTTVQVVDELVSSVQ